MIRCCNYFKYEYYQKILLRISILNESSKKHEVINEPIHVLFDVWFSVSSHKKHKNKKLSVFFKKLFAVGTFLGRFVVNFHNCVPQTFSAFKM